MSLSLPSQPPPIVGSHPFTGIAVPGFRPSVLQKEEEKLEVLQEQSLEGLPEELPPIVVKNGSPFWGVAHLQETKTTKEADTPSEVEKEVLPRAKEDS